MKKKKAKAKAKAASAKTEKPKSKGSIDGNLLLARTSEPSRTANYPRNVQSTMAKMSRTSVQTTLKPGWMETK